jgi:hypothetical protein
MLVYILKLRARLYAMNRLFKGVQGEDGGGGEAVGVSVVRAFRMGVQIFGIWV